MWPFLLIGGGVAAYSLLTMGVAGSRLLITPQKIRLRSGKLVAGVQFTNPSRQQFAIEYVFADVLANGSVVGQIREENTATRYIIPAERSATFDFPIKPSTATLLPAIVGILTSGQKATITLEGYYKVNGIRVPLSLELYVAK